MNQSTREEFILRSSSTRTRRAPHRSPAAPIERRLLHTLEHNEIDALLMAEKALSKSANQPVSTAVLMHLVDAVVHSRSQRRTHASTVRAMESVCRILAGRVTGRERSQLWQKLALGGFPGISELFI